MKPLNQYLLEDLEPSLSPSFKNNLKINAFWKILAVIIVFTISFFLFTICNGLLFSPQVKLPKSELKVNKYDDLKHQYKKNFKFYEENGKDKKVFDIKINSKIAEEILKYKNKIKKILPAIVESSHENKFITSALYKKLRNKRNVISEEDIDPLVSSLNYLRSRSRNKRDELKIVELEAAFKRCKKNTEEQCINVFHNIYEYIKNITNELGEMIKEAEKLKSKNTKSGTELLNKKNTENEAINIKEKSKVSNYDDHFPTSSPMKISFLEELELTTVKENIDLSQLITPHKGHSEGNTQIKDISSHPEGDISKIKCNLPTHKLKGTDELPEVVKSRSYINNEENNEEKLVHKLDYNVELFGGSPFIEDNLITDYSSISYKSWNPENRFGIDTDSLGQKWFNQLHESDFIKHNEQEELLFKALELKNVPKYRSEDIQNFDFGFLRINNNSVISLDSKKLPLTINKEIEEKVSSTSTLSPVSAAATTARAQVIPVTGETIKASAQFLVNPNFGIPITPYCFTSSPNNYKPIYQPIVWPNPIQMPTTYGHAFSNIYPAVYFTNNPNQQQNLLENPYFNKVSPAIPTVFTSVHNQQNQPNTFGQYSPPQVFCSYIPSLNNPPNLFFSNTMGSSIARNENELNEYEKNSESLDLYNIPRDTDIVYASFPNKLPLTQQRSDLENKCNASSIACSSSNQCILRKSWCNGKVDCFDASDESSCTCKSRLRKSRICDGYPDCPMGEDEMGCFGCDKLLYSCYDNLQQYLDSGNSSISMCYGSINRCDGENNCLNGKDEKQCSAIFKDVNPKNNFFLNTYTEGILHRNFKGKWYPVCGENSTEWALEACLNEMENFDGNPTVYNENVALPGLFIQQKKSDYLPFFTSTCEKRGQVMHTRVKCPKLKCGQTKFRKNISSSQRKVKIRNISEKDVLQRKKRDDILGIVGGKFCEPLKWPFIVAIFRSGKFHCGGVIYNSEWIITAAHCFFDHTKYYYEVYAGLLRRRSFSPYLQKSSVLYVINHEQYDRRTMKHDLALLKVSTPFFYNRWVRPICMPDKERIGLSLGDWVLGPEPGTFCSAVGWGAIHENGPGSDNLREVDIPIMKKCKVEYDNEVLSICAGKEEGGQDACQGDSGGPLFCKSKIGDNEWYLAGVVSHGQGCARAGEPGVYTRIALYNTWIDSSINEFHNMTKLEQPKLDCPGFRCVWGGGQCIQDFKRCNGIVDCLGGEDEVGCNFFEDKNKARNNLSENIDSIDLKDTVRENFSTENVFSTNTEDVVSSTTESQESTTTENTNQFSQQTTTEFLLPESSTINLSFDLTDHMTFSSSVSSTTEVIEFSSNDRFVDFGYVDFSTAKNEIIKSTSDSWMDISPTIETSTSTFSSTVDYYFTSTFSIIQNDEPLIPLVKNKSRKLTSGVEVLHPGQSKFVCKRILQTIDMTFFCDRKVDCEDGSDEENCSCSDYLQGSHNFLICDGKPDCKDLSDERNCENCNLDEFLCPISRSCIKKEQRCDGFADCEFKEDEKDCFALTNGKEVFLDADRRPNLNYFGYLTHNKNGSWHIICSDDINFYNESKNTMDDICNKLGFLGMKLFNTSYPFFSDNIFKTMSDSNYRTENDNILPEDMIEKITYLDIMQKSKYIPTFRSMPPSYRIPRSLDNIEAKQCKILFIECSQFSNNKEPLYEIKNNNLSTNVYIDILQPQTFIKQKPYTAVKINRTHFIEIDVFSKNKKYVEHIKNSNSTLKEDILNKTASEDTTPIAFQHYPWSVKIFASGLFQCNGVLLDKQWVAVPAKCYSTFSLENDYVTVVVGVNNKNVDIKSPFEQIQKVNCKKFVNSQVLLLHLENAVTLTRSVLPTFLPTVEQELENGYHNKCISVTYDKEDRIRIFSVKEYSCNTTEGRKSDATINKYQNNQCLEGSLIDSGGKIDDFNISNKTCQDSNEKNKHFQNVHQSHSHHHGIIMCQESKHLGWYPVAFYTTEPPNVCEYSYHDNDNMNSSIKLNFIIQTLYPSAYAKLQEILVNPTCDVYYEMPKKDCFDGFRCPLGNCLSEHQICDSKSDCHDGSDEDSSTCNVRKQDKCSPSDIKCRNGKCVSKTKFCDHYDDCGDLSDEPSICSCLTYLQVTDKTKICDGVRNCWDKSDESPALCNCSLNSFKCGSSDECIPKDFVCDGETDCPFGEDEDYCYGIEYSKDPYRKSDGYGQLIEQSFGTWYTKCFPKNKKLPTEEDIKKICKKLGYLEENIKPKFRFISDEIDENFKLPNGKNISVETVNDETFSEPSFFHLPNSSSFIFIKNTTNKYLDPTKIVIFNKFSTVLLHSHLIITMKPSRPIAHLVNWNDEDRKNCYRTEIKCEG